MFLKLEKITVPLIKMPDFMVINKVTPSKIKT